MATQTEAQTCCDCEDRGEATATVVAFCPHRALDFCLKHHAEEHREKKRDTVSRVRSEGGGYNQFNC